MWGRQNQHRRQTPQTPHTTHTPHDRFGNVLDQHAGHPTDHVTRTSVRIEMCSAGPTSPAGQPTDDLTYEARFEMCVHPLASPRIPSLAAQVADVRFRMAGHLHGRTNIAGRPRRPQTSQSQPLVSQIRQQGIPSAHAIGLCVTRSSSDRFHLFGQAVLVQLLSEGAQSADSSPTHCIHTHFIHTHFIHTHFIHTHTHPRGSRRESEIPPASLPPILTPRPILSHRPTLASPPTLPS